MWTNFRCRCSLLIVRKTPSLHNIRCYPAPPKRFYKKTGILYSDGMYEVTLDQRKLKTPRGNVFRVDNEPLALAVASEWDSQREKIIQSSMHLTALCSTVIDNPSNLNKFDLVQKVINYLDTDTVLFQSSDEKELNDLQQNEWTPLIEWFCQSYNVDISATRDISPPIIEPETKSTIQRHLLSYNFAAVNGFAFAIESLKSVILTLACVERRISVEKAVILSRLEEEYQTGHWGRVEWAHDINQMDLQARVAASMIFIYLHSSSEHTKAKHAVS